MMASNDPFESYRLNRKSSNNEPSQQEGLSAQSENANQNDPFESYRIKEAKGFAGIPEIGRHATRIASRIAETIGGIPGDLQSLFESGILAGFEKLTGKKPPDYISGRHLPTSGELKKISQDVSSGFTSPQGPTEKAVDEYVETVSSLVGPMKFRKALGVGIGSQLAKEGIKLTGLGEGPQEAGKLGTMFLLTLMNPKGAMKYASNQYQKANELAKGASIQATKLESNLGNMVSELNKGVSTPGKNAVIRPAEELVKKINNGKIPVQDLTAAKRDINTLMGDPTLLKREKILLKSLGKEVDMAIKPFEKINPEFSKAYRPANEIYGAVSEGNKAARFLEKTLGLKSVVGATVAEGLMGHPEAILPTIMGAGATYGAAKIIDFFTRLKKSPELRKYYNKAIIGAVKEDAGAVRKYADKIEEILESKKD